MRNGYTWGLLALVVLWACSAVVVAHGGKTPKWELRGKHKVAACEQCHGILKEGCFGPEKPEPQSTSCKACHWDDVPPGAEHYPGQECFPCHVEDGWDVGLTPPEDTAPEPTDTGTPIPTNDTGFDHDALEANQLCWECHEQERPDIGEDAKLEHWVNLPNQGDRWDCGPCHTVESWADADLFTPLHPIRTPHGTSKQIQPVLDAGKWVVACTPCHLENPPTAAFQCTDSCHLDDLSGRGAQVFDNPTDEHYYVYPWSDPGGCFVNGCHDYADYY